jgi:proteasome lid subunit RPN8/RPN11
MIELGAELGRSIGAEGERAYPNECCGFVLGRANGNAPDSPGDGGGKKAGALVPIVNAREAEEQYHRFRIEPEDFMRAEKEARGQGLDIIGFYHSHPDHPAKPSDYDREHALPFYSYLIVTVERGKAGALTSWELAANDRTIFTEEEILWR